jgi:pSer/pThr/pTyr-binding forkhead associated (FHA) protein
MFAETTIDPAVAEGATARVDAIACLDERVRRAAPARPTGPGRYIEVEGSSETLLIPLSGDVVRIGRGLTADLRLDEASVSRRHAILVNGPSVRVLDDRSSNGTFVNGARISQTELQNGDMLVLGRVLLRYLEV